MDRSGPIRCLKLDTFSPTVLTQAGLVSINLQQILSVQVWTKGRCHTKPSLVARETIHWPAISHGRQTKLRAELSSREAANLLFSIFPVDVAGNVSSLII
jgi:hypothetical protein